MHSAWKLAAIMAPLVVALAGEAALDLVKVEDWSGVTVGTKGIPPGWKSGQSWGSPAYDFVVEQDGPAKVLHLKSQGDSSTISKAVKTHVKATPILEWRWKATTLPKGGDSRVKQTDDQALQVYVTFERFPAIARSRIIGYVWDSTAPEGLTIKSQKSGLVTYVIVRSGTANAGKWLTESRNVYEDYKRIYGEEPEDNLRGIAVAIDSDDTKSSADGHFGEILFRKP
jgi:hypothetical protein